jgi:hypothetical protein
VAIFEIARGGHDKRSSLWFFWIQNRLHILIWRHAAINFAIVRVIVGSRQIQPFSIKTLVRFYKSPIIWFPYINLCPPFSNSWSFWCFFDTCGSPSLASVLYFPSYVDCPGGELFDTLSFVTRSGGISHYDIHFLWWCRRGWTDMFTTTMARKAPFSTCGIACFQM